ncbi:lymphoid-specific helicase-like isoform X2 [Zophobas morio]|uniref:lymphoid-specific helicase-like isoform X2 n=1 Tax=Zophobas morio TaxID=2755281 RepID=UPI0030836CDA
MAHSLSALLPRPSETGQLNSYHGTPQERKAIRRNVLNMRNFATLAGKRGVVRNNGKQLDIMPVIITTYEMVMRDHRAFQGIQWHYIIVDEGHRLKNLHCKLIKELKSCPSSNRLLLTGTPLQNSLSELWSLLNFLLPDIFDDLDAFQSWFDFDLQEEGRQLFLEEDTEKWLLSQLHKILEPFLLRRLKQDVEQALPLKRELIVYTPMSDLQKQMYTTSLLGKFREYVEERDRKDSCTNQRLSPLGDAALEDRRNHVKPESDEGPIKSSWRNIKLQNLLVHLRKICNHPYLVEYPLDHHGNYLVDDDLVKASGKLVMLDRLLPALQHRGHRLLLFSQMTRMLDILQDYCSLRSYKYSRLDGSLAQKERERVISEFNEDASIFIFLLSTRAGGMGINLTSADTVLIYDSDWNPQCDLQAQDRCHRIGQKKPVLVYRFVTDKSVEITLLNRAQAKRRLEKAVFHKAKFKGKCLDEATEPLTAEELSTLIEETGHVRVISSVDDVISNRELELLLDRSEGSNCKYA